VEEELMETPMSDDTAKIESLAANDLHHTYGIGTDEEHRALGGITFAINKGEFVAIVGPSGCGKTTLLRCLSGLMAPTSGEVTLAGAPVTSVPKDLTLVFQDYRRSLYPWLRVDANVEFPLKNSGIEKAERTERVRQSLDDVGLTGHAGKYPGQLSGGMQQRVSIARALAYRPNLLLMDEPFASVDAQTRASLEDVLLEVWERRKKTVLFVTHDIDESVYLADRVLVLSSGPSQVIADIEVDIPRPRDQIETKATPEFVELRHEVARLIRDAGSGTP
jgi:NitT/TauT family transport system ATP-binding protein